MELIKLDGIKMQYGKGENEVHALRGINLRINPGEMVAIIGPSGSGKSTLLNILGCLEKATAGEYFLEDKQISRLNSKELANIRNKYFGFVVQHFALIKDYSVFDNVEIPLVYAKKHKKERKNIIEKTLEQLGIIEKIRNKPTELSGGQCQRVAIARAIVNDPKIILADEPTGALDRKTGAQVIDIFEKLNKNGKTIIIVTHDLAVANRCKRIIALEDGKIKDDDNICSDQTTTNNEGVC